MPKYKVRRPIEHNQKLYLPQTSTGPENVKSVSHGQEIPVDTSGTIELNEKEAQSLTDGQVEAISESADSGKQSKRGKG
ncbi:MAG TPA: hypothetical protein VMT20_19445 [Terriglobia bacterium]|nr:hypothetical protein [Terriglobia bacterium]